MCVCVCVCVCARVYSSIYVYVCMFLCIKLALQSRHNLRINVIAKKDFHLDTLLVVEAKIPKILLDKHLDQEIYSLPCTHIMTLGPT